VNSSTSVSAPLPVATVPSGTSAVDFQSQMLAVFNETFSKLSAVIGDKSSETKSDWIKFSGDPKKIRSWYQAIMAQLSIAPWTPLYDSTTNSVVKVTSHDALNGKLYAKIIRALEGSALQHMLARKHVWANGILLLQELHQMYKPKCVPEVIAAKTVEFWGHTKRSSHESVDEYYNCFQELLEEINEDLESISTSNAIHHFIFTLGDEFQPLQNNYRLGTISDEWKTQDWPSLLVLCRDFYNSVNPKGPAAKRDHGGDKDPFLSYKLIVPLITRKFVCGFLIQRNINVIWTWNSGSTLVVVCITFLKRTLLLIVTSNKNVTDLVLLHVLVIVILPWVRHLVLLLGSSDI